MDSTTTDSATCEIKKPIWKKWWFWLGTIVIVGAVINGGGGSGGGSAGESSDVIVTNGVGKMKWIVPSSLAGDLIPTFERVSKDVFDAIADNPEMKTLQIVMAVECEDIYGKKSMKESTVKLSAEDITEMRKFTSASALSDGCMDWQMMFQAGYKMCGID